EYGFGLDGVLRKRSRDLYGVINGIDYNEWNPSIDSNIKEPYGLNRIEGKGVCRRDLQRQLRLAIRGTQGMPIIGMITRLAAQKGVDLVAETIDKIISEGFQVVILGTGEEHFHRVFKDVKKKYPKSVSVNLRFDPVLARRIYAGSDFFLMPSRYEPCGLGQLISLRYGTIPIVRKTGGLADTVEEFNPDKGTGNGFTFEDYSSEAMLNAIRRAKEIYRDKELWGRLVANAMQCNFSWEASAEKYIKLYEKVKGTTTRK
ncbi:MAG: glycosyltransferase, partial [Nitrospirota bacterium]